MPASTWERDWSVSTHEKRAKNNAQDEMMMDHCSTVVILLSIVGVALCEGKYAVVCRIGDPQVVKECDVLRQCLYEVHPVETAQSVTFGGGLINSLSSQNKLFALYGGPSSCGYFGNLINSCKGRQTLVETVKKQLQKSGYRGVDLQCDPGLSQINQEDYSEFLALLREEIGSGYVISVVIQSINIEPCVVNVLSEVVDLVTIPLEGCALQASVVQNLIGHGLSRQKILLDVPLPAVLNCPLDSGVNNLYSLVQNAVNVIDNQQLLGATIQLDRDDTAGVCAKGRFPLFKLLIALLKKCETSHAFPVGPPAGPPIVPPPVGPGGTCNFKGYVRDTRDCSSFYSCNNGVPNQFQCPAGLAFDLCSNTCQPVVQVNCDQNSCTLTGAVNGGCNQVPIPIPFPFLNPGSCQNNFNCSGHHHHHGDSDLCLNITSILIANNQTSALLELLANTQLEGTLALVNDLTRDLQLALGGIVGEVNNLLAKLLLHDDAIGGTLGQIDQMQRQMGLLEKLLKAVLELLDRLLGLNLLGGGGAGAGGAVAGAAGAAGLVTGLTGGGGGGAVATAAAAAGAAAAVGADAGAITNTDAAAGAGGLLSGLGRR